jgi:hypothetical protein
MPISSRAAEVFNVCRKSRWGELNARLRLTKAQDYRYPTAACENGAVPPSRTGLAGFAAQCVTDLPARHMEPAEGFEPSTIRLRVGRTSVCASLAGPLPRVKLGSTGSQPAILSLDDKSHSQNRHGRTRTDIPRARTSEVFLLPHAPVSARMLMCPTTGSKLSLLRSGV